MPPHHLTVKKRKKDKVLTALQMDVLNYIVKPITPATLYRKSEEIFRTKLQRQASETFRVKKMDGVSGSSLILYLISRFRRVCKSCVKHIPTRGI